MRSIVQSSIRLVPWRLRRIIRFVPFVAPLQRFVLATFLEGREFVHTVDAGPARLRYPVVLPDDKGVWTGTYEIAFVSAQAATVKKGDVCFDVGGWHGFCAGAMALKGAREVVVFEPLPQNCERISKLIDLNPNLPIKLVRAAVDKSPGTAEFSVMSASSMGKLADSTFQVDAAESQHIVVDVVSLDEWCERTATPFPAVIKIDVEGAELRVLEGAGKILAAVRPQLFIEAHTRELASNIADLLRSYQYSVKTLETGVAPDGSQPEVCHIAAKFARE